MESVLIYIKHNDEKAEAISKKINTLLTKKGIKSVIRNTPSDILLNEVFDLAIVIGGDGTFLAAVRYLNSITPRNKELAPVLGINTGSLGFLTECTVEEYSTVIESGLEKGFHIDERAMLSASIEGNSEGLSNVVNDIVINRNSIARVLDFEIFYNKEFVTSVKGDGVVISTPTGSTAYSLACGGPIVHPDLSSILITPISPHTLTNRPLVVSDSGLIEVRITSDIKDVLVTMDGQTALPVKSGRLIGVKRCTRKMRMVRPYGTTYFNILRNKLSFGMRG